jgi:serine/threonine protein kinase
MLPVVCARTREERYVLLERLGRGGAAEVWRARREGSLLEDQVCIKRPLFRLDASQRRMLIEEARVLSRVRHTNVVALLDSVEDESGGVFLVLELVRGTDLRALERALSARGERLAPPVVAAIGTLLCRALAAAQRALPGGVVHRDVTPHNVLVSSEGEVKLTDFGIARAFDRERWTRAGQVKGKTAYLSPEQLAGVELDVRSDLFALGVVLFELLSGRRPFGEGAERSTLSAIALDERVALEQAAPDVPRALSESVELLLQGDRSRRPATADAAARLLAKHADEQLAVEELRRLVSRERGPGLVATRAQRSVTTRLENGAPADRRLRAARAPM